MSALVSAPTGTDRSGRRSGGTAVSVRGSDATKTDSRIGSEKKPGILREWDRSDSLSAREYRAYSHLPERMVHGSGASWSPIMSEKSERSYPRVRPPVSFSPNSARSSSHRAPAFFSIDPMAPRRERRAASLRRSVPRNQLPTGRQRRGVRRETRRRLRRVGR